VTLDAICDRTIHADLFAVLGWLPAASFDLVFADPPYNLTRAFGRHAFRRMSTEDYERWLRLWLPGVARLLKPHGSLYLCADWRSSGAAQRVLEDLFIVRSRITWEREKGRGARANWKNNAEDIWFCTASQHYTFNLDAVKIRRRVRAPYTDAQGYPKDWHDGPAGRFRLTHPSNIWTDLTVPFWSMPENTDHPTQKPEKLLARVILASTHPGDVVFDPFLGAGTTAVVARKLGRAFVGVEIDETYCCLAEKRLALAAQDPTIQGYTGGVFHERGSGSAGG
jgi:site-specific DNA-methyltransferase (adenine-specific)